MRRRICSAAVRDAAVVQPKTTGARTINVNSCERASCGIYIDGCAIST